MIKILRKTDIVLIAIFIVFAVALLFIFALPSTDNLGYVIISVDGRDGRVYTLNLEEYDGREFVIHSERGYNVILIEDGGVRMTHADCPDDVCVQMGTITRSWHQITCLPNRVAVNLIPAQEEDDRRFEVDAVSH
ncbi:MAG: NusG domain II-containing protein [Clostridiales bacterium]|jgi:hypothetical protein|nr:NusG domain II-containing protein [Clostridiales bacterium]